ncbi:MAG: X-Pro dipeptidyl-peptidase [Acidobacteria bacterium]|nr:MAG: X-Pro dipeptidyl-peptidase [Acidobacteriota bacterium]
MFVPNFKRPESLGLPDPAKDGYRLEVDVAIPMRDGTQLATDLYFPVQPGVYPVLLERTPYGKHQSIMVGIGAPQFLARHGYIVAIQDTRGRYASEGTWYPFREEAWGEKRDGYDSVEWLARQPWSSGKVGSFGGSFAGFNQYLLVGDMPPHLAALFPRQAACSLRREWVYRGGAFELGFMFMWGARQSREALRNRLIQLDRQSLQNALGFASSWPLTSQPLFSDPFQWLHDYLNLQQDEEYWKQWDVSIHHAACDRPTYHMASWYDIFLGGSLRNFCGMRAQAASDAVRQKHRLIIGPWLHGPWVETAPTGRTAGEMDFGEEALWNLKGAMLRWFDCWLKGLANGTTEEPAVRYFVMGLNHWKTAEDWPPPGIQFRNLYFSRQTSGSARSLNDGSLYWNPPGEAVEPAVYMHDPDDPVPSLGGNTLFSLAVKHSGEEPSWDDLNAQAGSRDQRPIESRCLTFTTEPLSEDLEVTGPVQARLYVSSSALDTDFVVRLCDVYPDGRSMLICDGIQRARYREADYEPSLFEPGSVYPISIDLWATSNLFRAGHRIRVVVNSSCFPRYDINPGTGESAAKTTRKVKAENRVSLSRDYPSHIILPVNNA